MFFPTGKRLSRLADMFAEEALVGLKKQKAVRNRITSISEIFSFMLTSDSLRHLQVSDTNFTSQFYRLKDVTLINMKQIKRSNMKSNNVKSYNHREMLMLVTLKKSAVAGNILHV
jgi:hypothetical protein